jgi:hypothetical protein
MKKIIKVRHLFLIYLEEVVAEPIIAPRVGGYKLPHENKKIIDKKENTTFNDEVERIQNTPQREPEYNYYIPDIEVNNNPAPLTLKDDMDLNSINAESRKPYIPNEIVM